MDKFSEASDDEKSEKSKCWGVKKTTSSPIFPSSLLIMEPAIIILKIVKIREKFFPVSDPSFDTKYLIRTPYTIN